METSKSEKYYLLGGIIYERQSDGTGKKICILFNDERENNAKLLLTSLNEYDSMLQMEKKMVQV